MPKILTLRMTLLGLISWFVSFAVSFLFFDRSGHPVIPQSLFKSFMVVIFGGLGTWLLVVAMRRQPATLLSGFALGCYWLALNLILDFAILVPLTKMSALGYLYDIGLRYLLIPIIGAGFGAVAANAKVPGHA